MAPVTDPSAWTQNAIAAALGVLLGVSGADSVSLWGHGDGGPDLLAAVGAFAPDLAELRCAATAALAGDPPPNGHVSLATVPLPRRRRCGAARPRHVNRDGRA